MTTIKCTQCGYEIELTEALTKDLEKTVLAAEHAKHVAEMEKVKKEAADALILSKTQVEEKVRAELLSKVNLKFQSLQKDAEESKKDNAELREQLSTLMEQLRESKKARDNAQLEMQKKLAEEEPKIREEASKQADEKHRFNLAAKEKTISDLQKALDEAQRKAAQGSQQTQGEVVELELENVLKAEFHFDTIIPVGKGTTGADVMQIVHDRSGRECGKIIWESKDTKHWIQGWLPKLKEDQRSEKADIAVLVSSVLPEGITSFGNVDGVWVSKFDLAIGLAHALRSNLIQVCSAKLSVVGKNEKMEILYSYISGTEFKQHVEAIVESFSEMTTDLHKERALQERIFAKREKQIRRVVDNTVGIHGDLQGLMGAALPEIAQLALTAGEVDIPVLPDDVIARG